MKLSEDLIMTRGNNFKLIHSAPLSLWFK